MSSLPSASPSCDLSPDGRGFVESSKHRFLHDTAHPGRFLQSIPLPRRTFARQLMTRCHLPLVQRPTGAQPPTADSAPDRSSHRRCPRTGSAVVPSC